MLTPADKKFLTETFGTKDELQGVKRALEGKVADVRVDIAIMKLDITETKGDTKVTRIMVEQIMKATDKYAGRLGTLEEENKMGAITTARHGRHIQVLARNSKVKLPG